MFCVRYQDFNELTLTHRVLDSLKPQEASIDCSVSHARDHLDSISSCGYKGAPIPSDTGVKSRLGLPTDQGFLVHESQARQRHGNWRTNGVTRRAVAPPRHFAQRHCVGLIHSLLVWSNGNPCDGGWEHVMARSQGHMQNELVLNLQLRIRRVEFICLRYPEIF